MLITNDVLSFVTMTQSKLSFGEATSEYVRKHREQQFKHRSGLLMVIRLCLK